jgi:hypothetical protein
MLIEKASFWTEKDLKRIIDENLTEYSTLEFKSLAALNRDNKEEISKDIASFANAAGGVIIYGIKEVKEGTNIKLLLEDGLDINAPYNKEWLENIIDSHISPKIEGLYINPVKLSNDKYVYVVVIPQSNTAHMSGNNRYYKRYNFKSQPMDDYEVRDVMNRLKKPHLKLFFNAPKTASPEGSYSMRLLLKNIGQAFVRHFAVRICLPEALITGTSKLKGRRIRLNGEWYREYLKQSSPNQYIFPGFRIFIDSGFLPRLDPEKSKAQESSYVYWTIYTDNSGPQNGKTPLKVIIRNRLNYS